VECSFGILKNRFSCLQKQLRFPKPSDSARVIKAIFILHNFCILTKNEDTAAFLPEEGENENSEIEEHQIDDEEPEENIFMNESLADLFNLFQRINS
jgi:hypothetical protein